MAANFGPQCLKPFPQGQNLQNGNTRVHLTVPATRRVGYVARLHRRLLSHPYQSKLKEVTPVPLLGSNLPVSGSPIWPLYGSYGVYHCGQGGKAHGSGEKYPNILDDCLIRARDKVTRFQDTQTLLALCQELGWVVNLKKSELEPKQVFNFVGYQYDLVQGVVRPTWERWEALNSKINPLLSWTSCSVRQLMSLIGLLTAMEKHVHMRPTQWHLKTTGISRKRWRRSS